MFFAGLPSPAAAGAVTSVVIFQQYIEPAVNNSSAFAFAPRVTIYALPFAGIICSLLMISRVRYPHLLNLYLRGRKPISYLLSTLLIAGLIWWSVETSLVLIFCGYALWGLLRWLYIVTVRKLRRNESKRPTLTAQTSFSNGH
jgi:phosphatidylserine synthase